jgi:hypothetical protein
MKKVKIKESKENTYYVKGRGMPKGCQQCLQGTKTVLFINGICQKPEHCYWYCPISKERRDNSACFADEIKISTKDDLLQEINAINAHGMSITGGDPLLESNLEKTIEFIKYAKLMKGKKFHIHLYSNGLNFNDEIADKLAKAGLDEIRFNPPKSHWESIKKALHKGISVGAEVPVIPDKEHELLLEEFVYYLDEIGAEFINLNEFEYCFPNSQSLKERGFYLKKGTIASVVNSRKMALDLIKKVAPHVSIKMHFCSIIAKDYYQLKSRYLRRAKTIKLPHEEITEEGLLMYAQIEGNSEKLTEFNDLLLNQYQIPRKLILYEGDIIKLPYRMVTTEQFVSSLDEYKLDCNIIEIIPFREKAYFQITESTPIKIFIEELNPHED